MFAATPHHTVWLFVGGRILAVLYVTFDGLGWREHTSFLSGTGPTGNDSEPSLVRGGIYVLAYMGFVLVAPVLVLAAGIFAILLRITRREQKGKEG